MTSSTVQVVGEPGPGTTVLPWALYQELLRDQERLERVLQYLNGREPRSEGDSYGWSRGLIDTLCL